MVQVASSRERGTSPSSRAFSRRRGEAGSVFSRSLSSAMAAPVLHARCRRIRGVRVIRSDYWPEWGKAIGGIGAESPGFSVASRKDNGNPVALGSVFPGRTTLAHPRLNAPPVTGPAAPAGTGRHEPAGFRLMPGRAGGAPNCRSALECRHGRRISVLILAEVQHGMRIRQFYAGG